MILNFRIWVENKLNNFLKYINISLIRDRIKYKGK